MSVPLSTRLARHSRRASNGCLLWTGSTDGRMGYGKLSWDGRMQYAHRLSWQEANGCPVPEDKLVRHRCDNPPCIEPTHLLIGTQQENVADMFRAGRASKRHGEHSNSAKLTPQDVAQARAMRSNGALLREIAARFGICLSQASNIVNRRQWKESVVTTITLAEAIERTGLDVLDHLDRDAGIPIIDGIQCQGDLLIAPIADLADQVRVPEGARWKAVPSQGVEVLRGTAMGNPHTLLADKDACEWSTDVHDATDLAIGVLRSSLPVYLAHPEHGYAGIAPGMYVIRRQQEQADQIRLVED